jgi:hypothetical protein
MRYRTYPAFALACISCHSSPKSTPSSAHEQAEQTIRDLDAIEVKLVRYEERINAWNMVKARDQQLKTEVAELLNSRNLEKLDKSNGLPAQTEMLPYGIGPVSKYTRKRGTKNVHRNPERKNSDGPRASNGVRRRLLYD